MLYTYSEATSVEILALISDFAERLWLPHQVAREYHANRCGIILKESKRYGEISKALENIGSGLHAKKQHPYLDADLAERFGKLENEIKDALAKGENRLRELIFTDSICDKITEIFDGRVGDAIPEEKLKTIFSEGAERFENRIPPGFSDEKKPAPARYGDLVLCMQLIDHATTSNKPVIFVTDDLKEDWWEYVGERRVGPRVELRHEFRCRTMNDIYFYSSDTFVETARKRGKDLSDAAVKEIDDASKQRLQSARDERSRELLTSDPLDRYRRQEMLERMTHDPLEQYRKQQEMLELAEQDDVDSESSDENEEGKNEKPGDGDQCEGNV